MGLENWENIELALNIMFNIGLFMYEYQIIHVNSLLLKITSHVLLLYVVREFYRFLYENINPRFNQVYEGFKVKQSKTTQC